MKFGKFEISEFCVGAILICIMLTVVLHYTLAEMQLKEKTKQLEMELKVNTILLKEGE